MSKLEWFIIAVSCLMTSVALGFIFTLGGEHRSTCAALASQGEVEQVLELECRKRYVDRAYLVWKVKNVENVTAGGFVL